MHIHKTSSAALVLALASILAGSVYAQNVTDQPKSDIRSSATTTLAITVNSWVGWGPIFIAKDRGLFDGVDVQISFNEDAGTRRTSMITGVVDAYASSVDNLAIDATFGVRGKTVLAFDESAGGDGIVARKDITWENIKGRTVAVQRGLPGHFLLLTQLKSHGLKPNDIKLLDLDADKAGAAFVAGTVDVAVTWEPWISKAAALADGKKLVTTAELPSLIVDTLVVRDAALKSKGAAVRAFVKGWFKALEWYKANPSEGNAIIAGIYKLKPDEVADMASGVRFYDEAQNREFFRTGGPAFELLQSASQLWQEAGETKTTIQPTEFIDARFF